MLAREAAPEVPGAGGEGDGCDMAVTDPSGQSKLLLALAERERLERVLRLLADVLAGRSPRRVAEVLAESACLLTGARVGWVLLPDLLPVAVVGGPDARWVGADIAPLRWPLVVEALRGSPAQAGDLLAVGSATTGDVAPGPTGPGPQRHASGHRDVLTVDGRPLRSLCCMPLRSGGDVLGALVLAHHRAHAFSERQLGVVGAVADHLGHALGMCEAVAEKTRVAAALQETLLPPVLPEIDGVELCARYRPGGSGNLVGGDFYDVFSDGAGGWFLLLGDASGVGPEAAGLAGVARYTARALAETGAGPAAMLGHINRALLRAAPEDRFCTAVLAHLRALPHGGVAASLASAGHPSPLVQRRSGGVEAAVASTGLILGILPDAGVGEASVTLAPGDAIAFYTDGVVEAHSEGGDQFGEERLVRVLADACGRSAAGTARRLERAVVDFRAPEGHDDLAIVLARARTPA